MKTYFVKQIAPHETLDLRQRVLRPNQPIAAAHFPEDDVLESTHFGVLDETGAIVSVASIYHQSRPESDDPSSWRLRGMATDPSVRGQGIGAQALGACIDYVKSKKGTSLWCNARTSACGFYSRYGFEISGPEFEIDPIGPHYVMVKHLPDHCALPQP
jgi:predicted GNAT family N-acyltransferase